MFLEHLSQIWDLIPSPCSLHLPRKANDAKDNKENQSVPQRRKLKGVYSASLVLSKPKAWFDAITPVTRK